MVKATIGGEAIERFYSPISRFDDNGLLDLLIKVGFGSNKRQKVLLTEL